jgi:hypothetical protein
MGHNPIPPPKIRSREDRDLALVRQCFLDGSLSVDEFEVWVEGILRGEWHAADLFGMPPVTAKAGA